MSDANPLLEETMIFNGIDGASGGYLRPEMDAAQLSSLAQGQVLDPEMLKELKKRKFDIKNPHAGVEADARNLAETGWGVVFAHDADPAQREALQPLLDLRRSQAGERFKIFSSADGPRPGESKNDFLDRNGMGPGPANPDKVPYYLLVVGDPTRQQDWSESLTTILAFAYNEELATNTKNITPILENRFYFGEVNTIKVVLEHQHVTDRTTTEEYYSDVLNVEYLRSPSFSIAVVSEIQTKEPEPGNVVRKFWGFVQAGYKIGGHSDISLLVGTRQAGNICIGGVCRYEPAFQGVELKLLTRL